MTGSDVAHLDQPEPDLAGLVAAARRGDGDAFDQVVRRTYADTYTLAFRLTGDEDDARDVVQDAYLRAYRGLRRFRGEARFSTWMYRITANCASSLLTTRSRQRHELLGDDHPVADTRVEHDPEAQVTAGEERAMVAAALAGLPWRLRQVVVLRDIYDLPHAAIAQELGISEAAAKVRLHRARRRLREHLEASPPARLVPAPAGRTGPGREPEEAGADGTEEADCARAS
ncbi:MAG: RNA polymerase sigma factor [Acidimicrobiales bacterium]